MSYKNKNFIFHVLIALICILYFSDTKQADGRELIIIKNGETDNIIHQEHTVTELTEKPEKKDSTKNKSKSSLDGQQNIIRPETADKTFNRDAPFSKLTFRMMRTYIPGKPCPEDIKKLNNQNIEILGFMTPLNALEDMNEFLLCSAPPLSCYCAPPVFINEIIYVKLIDKTTDFITGAVRIKGQLEINFDIKDEYSDIIYSINAYEIN